MDDSSTYMPSFTSDKALTSFYLTYFFVLAYTDFLFPFTQKRAYHTPSDLCRMFVAFFILRSFSMRSTKNTHELYSVVKVHVYYIICIFWCQPLLCSSSHCCNCWRLMSIRLPILIDGKPFCLARAYAVLRETWSSLAISSTVIVIVAVFILYHLCEIPSCSIRRQAMCYGKSCILPCMDLRSLCRCILQGLRPSCVLLRSHPM